MKTLLLIALLPVAAFASGGYYGRGYSNDIRTNRYGTSEAGQVRRVESGKVIAVREVAVSRDRTTAGALIGATAGGVIGHNVGKGRNRSGLTAAGVLLGAIIGSNVESHNTVQIGHELVIRLDTGRIISVAQGPDYSVRRGSLVYVIYDNYGNTRVVMGQPA